MLVNLKCTTSICAKRFSQFEHDDALIKICFAKSTVWFKLGSIMAFHQSKEPVSLGFERLGKSNHEASWKRQTYHDRLKERKKIGKEGCHEKVTIY